MARKFIPFPKEEKKRASFSHKELLDAVINISVETAALLCNAQENDIEDVQTIALSLKKQLSVILDNIPQKAIPLPKPDFILSGSTPLNELVKTFDRRIEETPLTGKTESSTFVVTNSRVLENGGMAPPKEWKSITELNLIQSQKDNLIEEMRKLKSEGKVVVKSNFHHKTPLSIQEFTEPFKYLENMHDYNGSFLITLLKSNIDIDNQAATLQVDLKQLKDSCANGDIIILSVYDITGSIHSGEEKKFLLILTFDQLNGILKLDDTIFMNNNKTKLSTRQIEEVKKFCKAKKINL